MNRKTRTLIMILMALIGIGLFAYPVVSNYLFERNASTLAENYDQVVADTDPEIVAAAMKTAQKYNENLEGNPVHDPFLKGSGMALPEDYISTLDLNGTGIMGYISIPKIGVRLSIFHGTSEAVLQRGIGHLEGASLPIGGDGSHCVITGHTGLAHAKMFTDLIRLVKKDVFYLNTLGETLAYEVDQIKVVEPEVIEDLARVEGEDYCTLVTCTPYGVNSHRLLVRGKRIEYIPEVEKKLLDDSNPGAQWFTQWNMIIGLTIGVIFAIIIILILVFRRKREAKEAEMQLQIANNMEGSGYAWADTGTPLPPKPSGGKKKRRGRHKTQYWWEAM